MTKGIVFTKTKYIFEKLPKNTQFGGKERERAGIEKRSYFSLIPVRF